MSKEKTNIPPKSTPPSNQPTENKERTNGQENPIENFQQEELTPWQKEHLEYSKAQDQEPVWKLKEQKDAEAAKKTAEAEVEHETETSAQTDEAVATESELAEEDEATYDSFADRLPKVKKVRNKRLIRRLAVIISPFIVAIAVLLYLLSPFSKLGNITIVGNDKVPSEAVLEVSNLKLDEPLWPQFQKRQAVSKKIKKELPRVQHVSVSLTGLHSFTIKIEEYQEVAVETTAGGYHPILENGKILTEEIVAETNDRPILKNFSDQQVVKRLVEAYRSLPAEQQTAIETIEYAPSTANLDLVKLQMNDTNIVLVNIAQMVEKMAYYSQVASQMSEPGMIDMEVGIFSYPFPSAKDESTDEEAENPETENLVDENSEEVDEANLDNSVE